MTFGQRLVALEVAVRRRAARVHDALRDALVIEVGDLLAEDEVLEQRRAAQARLERVLVVGDRHALVGRERAGPLESTRTRSSGRLPGLMPRFGLPSPTLADGVRLGQRAAGDRGGAGLTVAPGCGSRAASPCSPALLALNGMAAARTTSVPAALRVRASMTSVALLLVGGGLARRTSTTWSRRWCSFPRKRLLFLLGIQQCGTVRDEPVVRKMPLKRSAQKISAYSERQRMNAVSCPAEATGGDDHGRNRDARRATPKGRRPVRGD